MPASAKVFGWLKLKAQQFHLKLKTVGALLSIQYYLNWGNSCQKRKNILPTTKVLLFVSLIRLLLILTKGLRVVLSRGLTTTSS